MVARPSPRVARLAACWLAILVAAIAVVPVFAAHDPPARERCERWPAFSRVQPTARNIVLVKVIEAENGVATKARTVDVIRGSSPVRWKLWRLDPGTPRGVSCDSMPPKPPVYADVGDRLVLAVDGTLPERDGRVDTLALVTLKPRHPNRSELERLTRERAAAIDDTPRPGAARLDPEPPAARQSLLGRVADFAGERLWPLAEAITRRIRVPWPERTPAPLPTDAEPLALLVQEPEPRSPWGQGWTCLQAGWSGTLRVVDGALVPQDDEPAVWPRGFSARLVDGVGELVTPDGTVIAREGEAVEAGGGYVDDVGFVICSVGDEHYGPAS